MHLPLGNRILGALFTAAVILGVLGLGSTAHAAASISVGGTCKVSANWTVNVSVNFQNTSGSPSRGFVNYVAMSSPNVMDIAFDSTLPSKIQLLDSAGHLVLTTYSWRYEGYYGGLFHYRSDPDLNYISTVRVDPRTAVGSHTWCSDYSSPVNITSKN